MFCIRPISLEFTILRYYCYAFYGIVGTAPELSPLYYNDRESRRTWWPWHCYRSTLQHRYCIVTLLKHHSEAKLPYYKAPFFQYQAENFSIITCRSLCKAQWRPLYWPVEWSYWPWRWSYKQNFNDFVSCSSSFKYCITHMSLNF